jgi:hypothetical protein
MTKPSLYGGPAWTRIRDERRRKFLAKDAEDRAEEARKLFLSKMRLLGAELSDDGLWRYDCGRCPASGVKFEFTMSVGGCARVIEGLDDRDCPCERAYKREVGKWHK